MRHIRGLLVAVGATLAGFGAADAKTPGHEYCFLKTCHRVKSLEETRKLIGVTTTLKASFYDDAKHDSYNPSNLTSSGEYFRADRPDNAASPIYPDGTKLLVWHPNSRKALVIRINNAGPYWGDRKLDLSRAAAERFGFSKGGVATLHARVIEAPTKAEATYKRGRSYPPVQGYLGQFANMDAAVAHVGGGTLLASVAPPKPTAPAKAPMPAQVPVQAPVGERQVFASAATTPKTVAGPLSPAGADALLETRVSPALTAADGRMPRLVALAAEQAIKELPKVASLQ